VKTRREVIGMGLGGAAAVGLGAAFWKELFAAAEDGHLRTGRGYGPRRPPDEHGIRLPEGFRARAVARGGQRVPGTDYVWHEASDGAATFRTRGGGWILVSNSEADPGGASAIRFAAGGRIADAYRVLDGTTANCSGGATPWGTWLSCEEVAHGQVWECDPAGRRRGVAHAAMGIFKHEAAAVDPIHRRVYLTEDLADGRLYRFTPHRWGDLRSGELELAAVGKDGSVRWLAVPDPSARSRDTRLQVPGSTSFARAEGIWFQDGVVYVCTTLDSTVHAYDTRRNRMHVIYDGLSVRNPPLTQVDQLTATRAGELFVCEDNSEAQIDIGVISPSRRVSRFLTIQGPQHNLSECTGVTFDPSGRRMYFASQRAHGGGEVYEVTGPFKHARRAAPL
jgi:secreted PhoX family phosphatase